MNRSILCVDDEVNVLQALRRALRSEGYRIHTALGGAAALELLAAEEIHVVLSDQRMPEMTGIELLRHVRTAHPHVVRAVLSGYAEAEVIDEALASGDVYRFLAKPWQDEDLKTALRACFEKYEVRFGDVEPTTVTAIS
jgi:CheY-like chemotaxis protein